MPMPATKPVITENEMKRVRRPNWSRPKATCSAPAMITRRNSASPRRSGGVDASACPAMSAEALVLLMTIIRLLLKGPAGDGRDHVGVKAIDRVGACEQRVRHPVRDAADRGGD